jgi:hypothetical protein
MNKLTTQRTNLLLLFVVGLGTVIGLNSLIPSVAFAQVEEATAPFLPILSVAFYVFFAFCLQTIANKLNIENSWLAWIPIVNLWIWVRCAGRPEWWVILFFIPLINLIFIIITYFDIPPRLNKPSILGLLIFIPAIGILLYLGILAFT